MSGASHEEFAEERIVNGSQSDGLPSKRGLRPRGKKQVVVGRKEKTWRHYNRGQNRHASSAKL